MNSLENRRNTNNFGFILELNDIFWAIYLKNFLLCPASEHFCGVWQPYSGNLFRCRFGGWWNGVFSSTLELFCLVINGQQHPGRVGMSESRECTEIHCEQVKMIICWRCIPGHPGSVCVWWGPAKGLARTSYNSICPTDSALVHLIHGRRYRTGCSKSEEGKPGGSLDEQLQSWHSQCCCGGAWCENTAAGETANAANVFREEGSSIS